VKQAAVLAICSLAALVAAVLMGVRAAAPPANPPAPAATTTPSTRPANSFRAAVIGGMFDTGFWQALAERYEKETGVHIELVAAGPKEHLDQAFKEQGGIDLITMHSSDTIINLVADGYATDPKVWLKNDLVIVGPAADPAGIKGLTDAAAALKKIADTKSPFVVHSSLGAQEVLRAILDKNGITLDPSQTTVQFAPRNQHDVLKIAADKGAYTLVGRIPFRSGKLPSNGLVLMVAGDERLRRPYVVAVANPARFPDARVAEAKRFAAYVLEPQTQAWISEFGRGKWDDQPLFFPVVVEAAR
jgi:tungstate transport system substrate-binding protein